MREREGTVGAAHPHRGRAASRCKAPEGPATFAVPLSCPGTTGLVTSAACEDLAQQHPRAGRSAGTERKPPSPPAWELHAATRRADRRHVQTTATYAKHANTHASCSHPHVHSQSPDLHAEIPACFSLFARCIWTRRTGTPRAPAHPRSALARADA